MLFLIRHPLKGCQKLFVMKSTDRKRSKLVVLMQYATFEIPAVAEWYASVGGRVKTMVISKAPKRDFLSKKGLLCEWAKAFAKWAVQPLSFRNRTIYCTTAQLPFMLLARLSGWCWGDYRVYFHNFYLHELGQKPAVKRALRFLLANRHLTILTQSEGEIEYYKALSDKISLKFIPFCSDFTPISGQLPPDVALPASYIFTGGYTNRDYRLMLRLAARFPDERFVFVASSLNAIEASDVPGNVILLRDLPKHQFESLLAGAKIVVVPLKEDVGASGQMLAVSAMRNGKPVVYADLSVISYFFRKDSGIPYEIGNLDSLAGAVGTYLSDPAMMDRHGRNSRTRSMEFTIDRQVPLIREAMELE